LEKTWCAVTSRNEAAPIPRNVGANLANCYPHRDYRADCKKSDVTNGTAKWGQSSLLTQSALVSKKIPDWQGVPALTENASIVLT
jgi:hypothetical protein